MNSNISCSLSKTCLNILNVKTRSEDFSYMFVDCKDCAAKSLV